MNLKTSPQRREGAKIIGLKDKETLKSTIAVKGPVVAIKGIFRNRPKEILSDEKHLGQRARRGAAVGLVNQPIIENLPAPQPKDAND